MSSLNLCIIEGILIDKLIYKDSICNFKVKGNKDIFNVITKLHLAEVCNRYLEKGSHVLVSGILRDNRILGREVKFLSIKKT